MIVLCGILFSVFFLFVLFLGLILVCVMETWDWEFYRREFLWWEFGRREFRRWYVCIGISSREISRGTVQTSIIRRLERMIYIPTPAFFQLAEKVPYEIGENAMIFLYAHISVKKSSTYQMQIVINF